MALYRLTQAAEADIVDILAWSETQFGSTARIRYERLIVTALIDVATDPARPGSLTRPELGPDVRSWHLRGSQDRASGPNGAVQLPRHFPIYRPVNVVLIAIGRVLLDAMKLERHLQETYTDMLGSTFIVRGNVSGGGVRFVQCSGRRWWH